MSKRHFEYSIVYRLSLIEVLTPPHYRLVKRDYYGDCGGNNANYDRQNLARREIPDSEGIGARWLRYYIRRCTDGAEQEGRHQGVFHG